MFSGGDSSGEGFNSLNFRHFRPSNTSGFVDWGSLAQQWIQMRDNNVSNNVNIPEPPPPPNISGNHNVEAAATVKKTALEEKGEADMEMADDEEDLMGNQCDDAAPDSSPPPPAPSMQLDETAGIAQPTHWFMQTPQATVPMIDGNASVELRGSINAQQAQTDWQQWPARVNLPPPTLHVPNINPTAHIPSLMKISVPNPNAIKAMPDSPDESSSNNTTTPTMDAAKRKILPAWIREGLEKMEREKLKQLEKDQQTKSGGEGDLQNDLVVKNKSEKTLASDSSGNEDDDYKVHDSNNAKVVAKATASASALTSATINDDSDVNEDAADSDDGLQQSIGKSYEQKLADLMIVVRRTLTELLLEVTNEEISSVANEAIKLRKSKASSAQVIHKSALSSITNKLGLAAYDDSSSETGSDTENESNDNETHEDSEEELKTSLRVKRRAFAKVSEEIEECIAANAVQEEEKLKYYRQLEKQQEQEKKAEENQQREREHHEGRHHALGERERDDSKLDSSSRNRYHGASTSIASLTSGKNYEREFGETTDSKLQQSSGKRQKERTTRFSDNKDSKNSSIATAVTYISQMQSKINNISAQPTVPSTVSVFPLTRASSSSTLDANSLYTTAGQTAYSGTGINSVLNAAEAALEKACKSKSKSSSSSTTERSRHHYSRHSRRHSSDEDSSDSDTSSSSSRGSKYSRHSSSRHKKRSSSDRHKHSSTSSSSRKSQRDYSAHKSSRHSSRRHSRSRSRSRSQSRSSYSSSRRRH